MNLKRPLELLIHFKDPNQSELSKLGIDLGSPTVFKEMTFYTIDNIAWATLNDETIECGAVCSGGSEFLTKLKYDELKHLIKDYV